MPVSTSKMQRVGNPFSVSTTAHSSFSLNSSRRDNPDDCCSESRTHSLKKIQGNKGRRPPIPSSCPFLLPCRFRLSMFVILRLLPREMIPHREQKKSKRVRSAESPVSLQCSRLSHHKAESHPKWFLRVSLLGKKKRHKIPK